MSARGFTLVELLLAATVVIVVCGAALALVPPLRAAADAQPASADVAQRARSALEAIARDLRSAGAGPAGGNRPGLPDSLPAVIPLGGAGPPADVFDGLQVTWVPAGAAASRLAIDSVAGGPLWLALPPGCPALPALCGFAAGDAALVFDGRGRADRFPVGSLGATVGFLVPAVPLARAYRAGSDLVAAETRTYRLTTTAAGGTIVRETDAGSVLVLVDHVAELAVTVLGDAWPPWPDAAADARPTYGPWPPPPGVDDPADAWGPGENCVVSIDADGRPVPRLATLGAQGALVPLTRAALADGPWCPEAGAPGAFDADLLRVRRVDLRLRVHAAADDLRVLPAASGPPGANPGRRVPDLELRVSVTPPNLVR